VKNLLLLLLSIILITACNKKTADGICCTNERDWGAIGYTASISEIVVPVVMHTQTDLADDIIENVNIYLKDANISMRLDSTIYYKPQYFLEDIVTNGVKENKLTKNEIEGYLNIFIVPNQDDLQGYLPTPVETEYLGEQKYQRMFVYMEDEVTIIHEFGHWGGLGHTFECRNMMGYDCFRDTLYSHQYDSIRNFISKYRVDYIE